MQTEQIIDFQIASGEVLKRAFACGSLVYFLTKIGSSQYADVYDRLTGKRIYGSMVIKGKVAKFKMAVESLALKHDFAQFELWDHDQRKAASSDISEIFSPF